MGWQKVYHHRRDRRKAKQRAYTRRATTKMSPAARTHHPCDEWHQTELWDKFGRQVKFARHAF